MVLFACAFVVQKVGDRPVAFLYLNGSLALCGLAQCALGAEKCSLQCDFLALILGESADASRITAIEKAETDKNDFMVKSSDRQQ